MLGNASSAAHTCNRLTIFSVGWRITHSRRNCFSQSSKYSVRQNYSCQRCRCHRGSSNHEISATAKWTLAEAPQRAIEGLQGLIGSLLTIALLLSSSTAVEAVTTSQDRNDSLTIKFKASKNPAIREAQEALVQTWGYASTQFLDPNFNGIDWTQQLQVQCHS